MIILKKKNIDFYICFLFNPKCGCVSLSSFLNTTNFINFELVHESYRSGDYQDPDYWHCNLEGAIKFFKKKNIKLQNIKFISTIRNPLSRYISSYFYSLNFSKVDKFNKDSQDIEEDLISYIENETHFHNFINGKFYLYNNHVVNHFIKLENLVDDIKYIFNIYDIKINNKNIFEMLNNKKNESSKKNININNEIKKLVFRYCENDYKYGEYNI